MSVTIPSIRAKMGSRTYYIGKMKARELSGSVGIASELQEWASLNLEDIYQRDVNRRRVTQEIAPYLANNPDRFFGAIIVWARDESVIQFERIMDVVGDARIPKAYSSSLSDLGVIVIGGDDKTTTSQLVALDGQHRLAALREVTQGDAMGPHKHEVPDDEVTVIFISDSDAVKTRGLFTILNRTARRVSKNDVLIMSETDGAAMAARKVTSSNLLAPRGLDNSPLIKWESNTISRRDTQITTLNAITEIVSIVARINNISLGDEQDAEVQPTPEAVDKASQVTLEWLDLLFKSLPLFQELRENPNRVSEERAGERPYSLLLRPVGLIAFFKAISVATDPHKGGLTDLEDAFRRMTKVDWSADSGLWRNIMVNAKGNISNKVSDLDLAAELAAWMVTGRSSNKSFQTTLTENFQRQLGRADAQLPAPMFAS